MFRFEAPDTAEEQAGRLTGPGQHTPESQSESSDLFLTAQNNVRDEQKFIPVEEGDRKELLGSVYEQLADVHNQISQAYTDLRSGDLQHYRPGVSEAEHKKMIQGLRAQEAKLMERETTLEFLQTPDDDAEEKSH